MHNVRTRIVGVGFAHTTMAALSASARSRGERRTPPGRGQRLRATNATSSGQAVSFLIVLALVVAAGGVVMARRSLTPPVLAFLSIDISGSRWVGSHEKWATYTLGMAEESQKALPPHTVTPTVLFDTRLYPIGDVGGTDAGGFDQLAAEIARYRKPDAGTPASRSSHVRNKSAGGTLPHLAFADLEARMASASADIVVARFIWDGECTGARDTVRAQARRLARSKKLALLWIMGVEPRCSQLIEKDLRPLFGDRLIVSYRLDAATGLDRWNTRMRHLTTPRLSQGLRLFGFPQKEDSHD